MLKVDQKMNSIDMFQDDPKQNTWLFDPFIYPKLSSKTTTSTFIYIYYSNFRYYRFHMYHLKIFNSEFFK